MGLVIQFLGLKAGRICPTLSTTLTVISGNLYARILLSLYSCHACPYRIPSTPQNKVSIKQWSHIDQSSRPTMYHIVAHPHFYCFFALLLADHRITHC